MRFSAIFTVLAAGSVAFAAAVPQIVAKRDAMDVPSAFKDLSTKLGDITPKLNGCNDPSCTSGVISSLVPIINSQTSALDNAPCGAGNTTAPALVAQVIDDIVTPLESHKNECDGNGCSNPNPNPDYSTLDDSLSKFLGKALGSCPGAVPSTPAALANLKSAMKALNLSLTLKACGVN